MRYWEIMEAAGRPKRVGPHPRAEEFFDLYKDGNTVQQIADMVGLSKQAIHQALNTLPAYVEYQSRQPVNNIDPDSIFQKWMKGYSIPAIADQSGCSAGPIKSAILNHPDYVRLKDNRVPTCSDPERLDKMVQKYKAGDDILEIADEFGFRSEYGVYRLLSRHPEWEKMKRTGHLKGVGARKRQTEATVIKLGKTAPDEGAASLAFMAELWKDTTEHPTNRIKRIVQGAQVEIKPKGNSTVRISDILSHVKGAGTKAMNQICSLADKHGVFIELSAMPYDNRMSMEELVDWYKRFGFSVTDDLDDISTEMMRTPE